MLYIYDRATMASVLSQQLPDGLNTLLRQRAASLVRRDYDLTDWTEFLVIQPGDTEADILQHVGFTPLTEPIDGIRFGEQGFSPFWDWLYDHGEWFELAITFGSTFAYVLFIPNAEGVLPELLSLCVEHAGKAGR